MANWAFEIDIVDNYVIGLTETLTDAGFRVWCFQSDEQSSLYLFSSEYLSSTSDANVYVAARQLVKFIDGLSYLLFENKNDVNKLTLTTVINVDTFSIVNVQRPNGVPAISTIDFSVYKPIIKEEENSIAHLLKLVAADVFIRDLLLVLSQGMDFKSMYQAYDQIKTFLMENEGSLALLGFSKGVLERFTHTANNFDTIGTDARHGRLTQDPPKNPMPLKEAQELISELVFAVLETYYKVNLKGYVIKDRQEEWGDMYDSLYD